MIIAIAMKATPIIINITKNPATSWNENKVTSFRNSLKSSIALQFFVHDDNVIDPLVKV